MVVHNREMVWPLSSATLCLTIQTCVQRLVAVESVWVRIYSGHPCLGLHFLLKHCLKQKTKKRPAKKKTDETPWWWWFSCTAQASLYAKLTTTTTVCIFRWVLRKLLRSTTTLLLWILNQIFHFGGWWWWKMWCKITPSRHHSFCRRGSDQLDINKTMQCLL